MENALAAETVGKRQRARALIYDGLFWFEKQPKKDFLTDNITQSAKGKKGN
jgi:phage terminase large subunit-like protein